MAAAAAAATPAAGAAPAAAGAGAAAAGNKAGSIPTTGASVSNKDVKGGGASAPAEPTKAAVDAKRAMLKTEREEGDDDKDWDAAISNYSAGPRMSVVDLMSKDKEDKSLEKYKKQLLGDAADTKKTIAAFPNDTRHCIVESITLVFPGRPPIVINPFDKNLKAKPYTFKEGVNFKTVIKFFIQHEIVSGLRFSNKIYKHSFKVDSRQDMLGSFAPQLKAYEITMPEDTTPSGYMGRGNYTAKCKIIDDDKTKHCAFEYAFVVAQDWPAAAGGGAAAAAAGPK